MQMKAASASAIAGKQAPSQSGLEALLGRSLLECLWRRRTHRVSRGTSVKAGTVTYVSSQPRQPLSALEEALLIAVTGCTGLTMPDRPFSDPAGDPIMAKPNLTMAGRSAGSPLPLVTGASLQDSRSPCR